MDVLVKIDENGEVVEKEKIAHCMQSWERLIEELPKDVKIAMEANTYGLPLYKYLKKCNFEVHLAHAKELKKKLSSKKKTDWRDCIGLAQLLRVGLLPEAYVPDDEIEEVRILTRHRVTLGKKLTAVKNRIHALLAIHGITYKFSDLFGVSGEKFLQKIKLPDNAQLVLSRKTEVY